MTPNIGTPRPRRWDREKEKCDVCLTCKLRPCVLDVGRDSDPKCPWNKYVVKQRKKRKKK